MYTIQKNITRLDSQNNTYFLDPKELELVKGKLRKNEYSIYYPYPDSEKNIIYKKNIPEVLLYEIKSKIALRHQDILGTMYSLNIASDLFGDVIIYNNHYYVYILPILQNYFETNFTMIKNSHIEINNIPLNTLDDYYKEYEEIELIVSSNRIDTVLSSILHVGRSMIDSYLKRKDVLLNYEVLKNSDYKLKEGDTFSIRKIGKFYYDGVIKNTKSNHLIIKIKKCL